MLMAWSNIFKHININQDVFVFQYIVDSNITRQGTSMVKEDLFSLQTINYLFSIRIGSALNR